LRENEFLCRFIALPARSRYATDVTHVPVEGNEVWQDPAFLDTLACHATTVMVGEDQRQALNLKPASPR
jgi:hypothetical protein